MEAENFRSRVSKPERKWVILFGIIFMTITTLPYLLGVVNQNEQWVFSGFLFGVEDGNSYIAKMMAGHAGDWLFRTPFTAYPQSGVFVYFPYILLGKMVVGSKNVHAQLLFLFHCFRIVGGFLSILASYDFIAYFVSDIGLRKLGVWLAAAGGGLGWLLVIFGKDQFFDSLPLEFYSPETFGFLSLYGIPHLALGRAFLLWGLLYYLQTPLMKPLAYKRDFLKNVLRYEKSGMVAGLFLFGLAIMQPLTVVIAWVLVISHILLLLLVQLWKRFALKLTITYQMWISYLNKAFWAWLISAPIILYSFMATYFDPFLNTWISQNIILSPHPIHYIVAYGIAVPFVIIGVIKVISYRKQDAWFLVSWVLIVPFLIYAPYKLQRRLAEGVWIGLLSLALIAVEKTCMVGYDNPIKVNKTNPWRWAFILSFPSTLILLAMGFLGASSYATPVYQSRPAVEAYNYLNTLASPGDVVLSSYDAGNVIPVWASVRVVIGHGPESSNLTVLQPKVNAFFSKETPDSDRMDLLNLFNVKYLIWGRYEKNLGDWDPRNKPYLKSIGNFNGTMIFEIIRK